MSPELELSIAIGGSLLLPIIGWIAKSQYDKGLNKQRVDSNDTIRAMSDKVLEDKLKDLKATSDRSVKEIYQLQLLTQNHEQKLAAHQKENTVIAETLKENTTMMHELQLTLAQIKILFEQITSGKLIIANPEKE